MPLTKEQANLSDYAKKRFSILSGSGPQYIGSDPKGGWRELEQKGMITLGKLDRDNDRLAKITRKGRLYDELTGRFYDGK